MENYFIVALDFDGCIAYGEKAKIFYAKKFYDINVNNSQITRDTFPLGREKYEQLMAYVASHGIMEFELAPGVKDVIDMLHNENFRFVIITSRHDTEERPELSACINFCKSHSLKIDYFHNTSENPKDFLCNKLHTRAIIDDTLKKLLELKNTDTELYFFSQSWNQHEKPSTNNAANIHIVNNWVEFGYELKKLIKQHEKICLKLGIENTWKNLSMIVKYKRNADSIL
jgi:hypothetical protein